MGYLRSTLSGAVILLGLWAIAANAQGLPKNPQTPALQTRPAAPGSKSDDSQLESFIHQQFGDGFSLIPNSKPFVRDIDGDGVDDFVIAAMSKKPLLDAGEHSYRVIDPYYAFYGYGDPKITNTFGSEDLQTKNLVILIVNGAGSDAWRAEVPKSKYVIINMPFKTISVRRLQMKKKVVVNAIFSEESDSTAVDSVIYWDGRQYKYFPLGMSGADN